MNFNIPESIQANRDLAKSYMGKNALQLGSLSQVSQNYNYTKSDEHFI